MTRRAIAEWHALADGLPRVDPTDEPDPHRCDQLEIGSPQWAHVGSLGHRCQRCGNACGSTDCHEACCGTESYWRLRKPSGSYCSGHPCPACSGRGERPDAGVDRQLDLLEAS